MGSKRDKRRQKTLERKKKSRKAAQEARKRRVAATKVTSTNLKRVAEWPLGECYISENWPERHAQVRAVFTRVHPGGRHAVAQFTVDLQERGVIEASVSTNLDLPQWHAELARLSQESAMIVTEPAHVAHLVTRAVEFGLKSGHRPPDGLAKGVQLMGAVNPEESPHTFLWGDDEPEPQSGGASGLWGSLKQRLGWG